jgi:hypothetical protein
MTDKPTVAITEEGLKAYREQMLAEHGEENTHLGVYARGNGQVVNFFVLRELVADEAKRGTAGSSLAAGVAMLVGEAMEYVSLSTDESALMIQIMMNVLKHHLSDYLAKPTGEAEPGKKITVH